MGFVADVDGVELGAAAFVADCGGGFFAAVLLDVGEDYGGALDGGLAGAGEAYALGGAGDDDHFVCEATGHGKKLEEFNIRKEKDNSPFAAQGKETQSALRNRREDEC